ncbi:MAG: hypothetical protein IKL73_07815 [Lachnospiraceae bacterium]|nr:hypothetical protein [Lachnospiraceae bacterium]
MKLDKTTKVLLIISVVIAVVLMPSFLISAILCLKDLRIQLFILFILMAIFTTFIGVVSVLFLMKKKKKWLIADGIAWLAFAVCVYLNGGSPMFVMLLCVPYAYLLIHLLPKWSEL